jgi:glycosyltransferase involved in cell wall biosynthesis
VDVSTPESAIVSIPTRLTMLCPSFGEYAGIGRIAAALAREFGAAGHHVSIVCRPGAPQVSGAERIPRLELPMHQLPRRWGHLARHARLAGTLARTLPRLHSFLENQQTEILFVLAISTYAPLALAATRWLPVVVSLQGGEPDGRFAAHPRVFRSLLGRAAAVTACATSLLRQARQLAPRAADRLTVIPNGVDVERFTSGASHRHPRPYLLAAGRFTRQKGFDVLLEAAANVQAIRNAQVDMLIAGDGAEEDRLRRLVDQHRLTTSVCFLGAVDAERLASLYRGALAVVVPSRWEGLPLVCLEAMASGRPVVASNVDGIPDAVLDGETGLLVPPEDADALAAAIERLVGDPALADRLGAAGLQRARTAFSWPSIAERYLAVFGRVATRLP